MRYHPLWGSIGLLVAMTGMLMVSQSPEIYHRYTFVGCMLLVLGGMGLGYPSEADDKL